MRSPYVTTTFGTPSIYKNGRWTPVETYEHCERFPKPNRDAITESVNGWNVTVTIKHKDCEECHRLRAEYLRDYPRAGYATMLSDVKFDGEFWICGGDRYSNCN